MNNVEQHSYKSLCNKLLIEVAALKKDTDEIFRFFGDQYELMAKQKIEIENLKANFHKRQLQ